MYSGSSTLRRQHQLWFLKRLGLSRLFRAVTTLPGGAAPLKCLSVAFLLASACPNILAQTPTPSNTRKLEFEVASVRPDKSDDNASMNVDPTGGDTFTPVGGLYIARNIVLISYISFAYNLSMKQLQSAVTQAPWIAEARFDIQARAAGSPSKDQFRLMMQSLLEDRFKLAIRFETREVPIFSLVFVKPGVFGPQLRLHPPDDPVCTTPASASSAKSTDVFPTTCNAMARMVPSAPGRMRDGARDVPMSLITAFLTGVGDLGRPLVDHTGIRGNVDYSLEWIQAAANVPPGAKYEPDESAPTFDQALKEQLGLKMISGKGPVSLVFIDHIERPSEN